MFDWYNPSVPRDYMLVDGGLIKVKLSDSWRRYMLMQHQIDDVMSYISPCETNDGKKLLREWLLSPLVDLTLIEERQSIVESLIATPRRQATIFEGLKELPDLTLPLLRVCRSTHKSGDLSKVLKGCEALQILKKKVLRLTSPGDLNRDHLDFMVLAIPDINHPEYQGLATAKPSSNARSASMHEKEIARLIVEDERSILQALQIAYHLDCYRSLSLTSFKRGNCKPRFVNAEKQYLNLVNVRNPLVTRSAVPVTARLSRGQSSTTVITGPRRSGKTSLIETLAVTIVLAQAGCFVAADSAELTVFDGLFVTSPNRDSTKDIPLHELVEQATSKTLAVIDLSHNDEYVCHYTSSAEC